MHWKDHAGGWLARHDEWLESSIENLFVAGEITSVDGADAALEKGRIAAIGILRSLGRLEDNRAHNLAATREAPFVTPANLRGNPSGTGAPTREPGVTNNERRHHPVSLRVHQAAVSSNKRSRTTSTFSPPTPRSC